MNEAESVVHASSWSPKSFEGQQSGVNKNSSLLENSPSSNPPHLQWPVAYLAITPFHSMLANVCQQMKKESLENMGAGFSQSRNWLAAGFDFGYVRSLYQHWHSKSSQHPWKGMQPMALTW